MTGLVVPVTLLAGVFGLVIGSFLNVVAYRVPIGLSIVSPPSACPGCAAPIRPRDNIPLLSWLLLRGMCRGCRMTIPVRYPLVELLTGAGFALVAARFVPPVLLATQTPEVVASALELAAFLYLWAISVALAVIDIDVRRLPDVIVLPGYAVAVLLLGAVDLLRGDAVGFGTAALGAGSSVALYAILAIAKPGGMGLGDLKLAGVLGLFLGQLGAAPLVVGVAASFLLGGVFGIALILARRVSRDTPVPFGPWMLIGAWVGVFAGTSVADGYLRVFGLA